MSPTTINLRGRVLYVTVLDHIRANMARWDQRMWRGAHNEDGDPLPGLTVAARQENRCNTVMCFAGWACELTGGRWFIEFDLETGKPFLAGKPVEWHALPGGLDDALIAEPGDPAWAVFSHNGYQLIRAEARANRLLGLEIGIHDVFSAANDLEDLEGYLADYYPED